MRSSFDDKQALLLANHEYVVTPSSTKAPTTKQKGIFALTSLQLSPSFEELTIFWNYHLQDAIDRTQTDSQVIPYITTNYYSKNSYHGKTRT